MFMNRSFSVACVDWPQPWKLKNSQLNSSPNSCKTLRDLSIFDLSTVQYNMLDLSGLDSFELTIHYWSIG